MGETPRWKRVLAGVGVLLVAGMAGPGIATARAADIPAHQINQLLTAIATVNNNVAALHTKVDYVQAQLGAIQQKVNDESRLILLPRVNAGVTAINTANTRLANLDTAVKAVQQKVNDESRDIQLPAIASAGAVAGSARAEASAARTAAVGARTEAGAARTQASQARTAAVGARTEAGAARTQASQARTEAAAARTAAAAAQSEAAAARVQAETGTSYALEGWWAAFEAGNTADEIKSLAELEAQADANFRSATASTLSRLVDALNSQADLIASEGAEVRQDMVTIANATRNGMVSEVEALLDAMQDEFQLALQDLQHAVEAGMSAGADMSPMLDAWAATECAAPRDTPWWMLTTQTGAEGVWQAQDSWCSVGRGDLRELGERMRDSTAELQMFLAAESAGREQIEEEAEQRRDALIESQVDRVRDSVRENIEQQRQELEQQAQELRDKLDSVSDSNDDLLEEIAENTARAADAAERGVSGDLGEWDGTIPGAGDDSGFDGAVSAGQQKAQEWMEPFECIANVAANPPTQSLCGAGPVLSIPIPGGDPFEWRPFSWCGDASWLYMARDIAGWSLVVLAAYGWINSIFRAFGYGMASQHQASVAAAAYAHQSHLPGEHRGVKL